MKESEEAQAAGRYIKTIKDPDKRRYAQRYFFYLLGYDLKPPSPRPVKEEEARELQVALDRFFETPSSQYSTTVKPSILKLVPGFKVKVHHESAPMFSVQHAEIDFGRKEITIRLWKGADEKDTLALLAHEVGHIKPGTTEPQLGIDEGEAWRRGEKYAEVWGILPRYIKHAHILVEHCETDPDLVSCERKELESIIRWLAQRPVESGLQPPLLATRVELPDPRKFGAIWKRGRYEGIAEFPDRQKAEAYVKVARDLGYFATAIPMLSGRYHVNYWPYIESTGWEAQTRKYWVEINEPGSSSYVRGAIIPYQEFEVERKKILERGGKLPSIKIRHEPPPGNGNGNGDKQLPATVEAEPIPEKYKWLIPFIGDEPLPPEADRLLTANILLPAIEVAEGESKRDAVLRRLAEGVEGIQDSAQFRLFLTTMAKFHTYSYSNQILIMLQRPSATKVAGFVTWKDLGRWVKKGESGIAILGPIFPPKPKKAEDEKEEETEIILTPSNYLVVHVFDLSQTEGKPLPEFDVPVLTGEANEELYSKVLAMAKAQGLEVSFDSRPHMDPSIKGMYSAPKSIWVRPEESKAQQLKSLLHEIAHYYSEGVFRIPRQDAETIAESAAFAVGAHYGFDSGVRSFPYVALWAQDKKTLSQNLNTIRKVTDTMLHALEGNSKEKLMPFAVSKGTCYEDAWRFLLKEKEGYLVHGSVWSEGKRIGHAWVETETGYIWEPETGQFYTKLGFENIAAPVEVHRYDVTEASIMAGRTNHFGPWTDEERGAIMKRKQPAVIPTKPSSPNPREEVEFVSDSPEYIPFTIEQIGYREKLDNAFQSRIAQVQGAK